MRPAAFLAAAALLLALTAALGTLPRHTEAEDFHPPAITDCAQAMGAAAQGESCTQSSLGSTPGLVISHAVLSHACGSADLHVIRYTGGGGTQGPPLVATYCG